MAMLGSFLVTYNIVRGVLDGVDKVSDAADDVQDAIDKVVGKQSKTSPLGMIIGQSPLLGMAGKTLGVL